MVYNQFISLSPEQIQIISKEQAWHYKIIPNYNHSHEICFFIDKSNDISQIQEELEVLFGKKVLLELTESLIISRTLSQYYFKEEDKQSLSKGSISTESNDFLLDLVQEAKVLRSSDIHFEVYEEKCRIRIRIDGSLVERYVIIKTDYPSLINRVKILANLDIAEKRLPQDGRIFFQNGDKKFDIRVSVVPTLYGEKVVMRLLGNNASHLDIVNIGLSEIELENYLTGVQKSNGIVLISGPTGSGKTTTLYATLKYLNKENRNILTIEDPIEYTLEGINQVQLKESIGLNFSSALRTFLRQDPDIIMVGEIRDVETAQMAIRAALTGHLVLSTIHTNSAWGTVQRLADMGVPAYLLSNTLNLTVAQRLIKLLCNNCKEEESFENSNVKLPRNYIPPKKITKHYTPKGCEHCFYTGYKGRRAIYEVILIDQDLSKSIRSNEFDIKNILEQKNIKSLADNAFELLEKGETSLEEVYPILLG
ncbi:general secretion pathway protein GspE [bacterium 336/3]|nr:general secretion pathway protein GspE [bacterium 336/3]